MQQHISYVEGKTIPDDRGIMTEGVRETFVWFVIFPVKRGDMKEHRFWTVLTVCKSITDREQYNMLK